MASMYVSPNRKLAAAVALALAALAGCSSHRQAETIPETGARNLPPVPSDLTPRVYSTDVVYDVRCAEVPSGMNNCMDLMRRVAKRQLAELLEQDLAVRARDLVEAGPRKSDDGAGTHVEMRQFLDDFSTTISGRLTLRKHESPVFQLPQGPSFAFRVMLVRDETDWRLLTEAIASAETAKRPLVAEAFRKLRAERLGDAPPDRKHVDDVERRIAEHFEQMWAEGLRNLSPRSDAKEKSR